MTTPNGQVVDPGNHLLAKVPVWLGLGSVTGPDGTLGVMTFRTATTTFSILVTAQELSTWMDQMAGLSAQLGGPPKLAPASILDVAAITRDRKNGKK